MHYREAFFSKVNPACFPLVHPEASHGLRQHVQEAGHYPFFIIITDSDPN